MAGHPPPPPAFPLPPVLTYPSSAPPELITQGAEGRLYKTTYLLPSLPCALKHRPPKPYRHPVLDARLTRQRILAEARVLARCRREGVAVPAVYCVDEAAGWMMMEWVAGQPVRAAINRWLEGKGSIGTIAEGGEGGGQEGGERNGDSRELVGLMRRIGQAVGGLHRTGIVHGDLTTSNMMLRPWRAEGQEAAPQSNGDGRAGLLDGEIVLIDFGLASQSTSDEDRAVDLYVLERAFGSTHPRAEGLFAEVLRAYKETFKQAVPVLRKLEDVRMRGRKRSMIG
ncbi:Tyrosine protein kinase [Pleurostoma richardsiae]|uniref:EKC/KEOPS complex subunit BUD32 n=1 Tax=Pleurostoma richardsiae TaxID=41990 RepID=A0AA38S5H6_9PEZI|nr:Tyrosine protein kinase [Pleurostoma richardsiae]